MTKLRPNILYYDIDSLLFVAALALKAEKYNLLRTKFLEAEELADAYSEASAQLGALEAANRKKHSAALTGKIAHYRQSLDRRFSAYTAVSSYAMQYAIREFPQHSAVALRQYALTNGPMGV